MRRRTIAIHARETDEEETEQKRQQKLISLTKQQNNLVINHVKKDPNNKLLNKCFFFRFVLHHFTLKAKSADHRTGERGPGTFLRFNYHFSKKKIRQFLMHFLFTFIHGGAI